VTPSAAAGQNVAAILPGVVETLFIEEIGGCGLNPNVMVDPVPLEIGQAILP
jgi:hypothetical protein